MGNDAKEVGLKEAKTSRSWTLSLKPARIRRSDGKEVTRRSIRTWHNRILILNLAKYIGEILNIA
jgi:hypothetical protein